MRCHPTLDTVDVPFGDILWAGYVGVLTGEIYDEDKDEMMPQWRSDFYIIAWREGARAGALLALAGRGKPTCVMLLELTAHFKLSDDTYLQNVSVYDKETTPALVPDDQTLVIRSLGHMQGAINKRGEHEVTLRTRDAAEKRRLLQALKSVIRGTYRLTSLDETLAVATAKARRAVKAHKPIMRRAAEYLVRHRWRRALNEVTQPKWHEERNDSTRTS